MGAHRGTNAFSIKRNASKDEWKKKENDNGFGLKIA